MRRYLRAVPYIYMYTYIAGSNAFTFVNACLVIHIVIPRNVHRQRKTHTHMYCISVVLIRPFCDKFYLLYKDEKPSVHPSVGTFFGTSVAPWFLPGSTPDMLDVKHLSFKITKSVFRRF